MKEPNYEKPVQKVDPVFSKDKVPGDEKKNNEKQVHMNAKPVDDKADTKNSRKREEEELSEEDQNLKDDLEMTVERIMDPLLEIRECALNNLITLIRTTSSSMATVPKPLKFLRPHYDTLVKTWETWTLDTEVRKKLAGILSVLAMSYSKEGKNDSLFYRLRAIQEPAGLWGHDYVRHLAAGIISEYQNLVETRSSTDELLAQALDIVPYLLKHNAEADAVDLLMDIEALDKLPQFLDTQSYSRVCLYLMSCMQYAVRPDDIVILQTAYKIYMRFKEYAAAIQVALRLQDRAKIEEVYETCQDRLMKKQLAFILVRQGVKLETDENEINEIFNNSKLSFYFMSLCKDLEITDPKSPEDIHKSYLDRSRTDTGLGAVDQARQNIATTFVNAFANAASKTDKCMVGPDDPDWVYKNKDCGMMCAVASIGAIMLWDIEGGLMIIDKYLNVQNENIRAGALLAIGLVGTKIRNESEPSMALLSEYLSSSQSKLKIAAIIGLGMAYAGTTNTKILELLLPIVSNSNESMEVTAITSLSLGLVFVGQAHGEIVSTIVQNLAIDRTNADLNDPHVIFMSLGLALLFLGRQELVESTIAAISVMNDSVSNTIKIILEICAYAGTGNVLKIQSMLHHCSQHVDTSKQDSKFQSFAVLGIALIAMGEDIGAEMALRSFNHLMHHGEAAVRRAVPLAIGLLSTSNPQIYLLDMLSKYSHDSDDTVGINTIFAMGLVGAGTNNARLAQMLRQLSVYYQKHPNHMFFIRIAQGILHLGKGTLTLNPLHSNKLLMCPLAISGLLINLTEFIASGKTVLGNSPWILYYLLMGAHPRLLMTLDEDLKPLPIVVRVGQAVDVVGQAGRPKTITAFQTHTTPVLLGSNERAELGTDEYVALSNVLEGFVVLKKSVDSVSEDMDVSN